jgi:hypothetical protein
MNFLKCPFLFCNESINKDKNLDNLDNLDNNNFKSNNEKDYLDIIKDNKNKLNDNELQDITNTLINKE